MICMNYNDVEPIALKETTYRGKPCKVKGASIRWLTHSKLGGSEYRHSYALRHFTIAPGDIMPMHNHKNEQCLYMLSGKALSLTVDENGDVIQREIRPGDFIYTYPYEPHGTTNLSQDEPAIFLCCIDCPDGKESCAPPVS
jgi:quercetin dioxygenase-like cupin family protein